LKFFHQLYFQVSKKILKGELNEFTRGQKFMEFQRNLCNFARKIYSSVLDGNRNKVAIREYLEQLFSQAEGTEGGNVNYVSLAEDSLDTDKLPIKLIAFYLPQFHPIKENDEWWGKGFTDWTNVSKAVPQFVGHYQPHLPGELGFYDLRLVDVQKRQVELAKHCGVYGFCFHHYWFAGKRLLERPVRQFLDHPEFEMPFCLCWANENWTRRWDGSENEILIAQQHSPEDDIAFIHEIERELRDSRYIRVNGRPLLIVYRASILPDARATAERWREYCIGCGIGDLYLVAALTFEVTNPLPYGFDAAVEFPPHQVPPLVINDKVNIINPNYSGLIGDFETLAENYEKRLSQAPHTVFKAVMPSWDNEARRPGRGVTFHNASPDRYANWLDRVCQVTLERNQPSERLVFVNAWNEWGEGAHLEPDRKYGHAYLNATASILRKYLQFNEPQLNMISISGRDGFSRDVENIR
jgi:lipopolysaccharide biosynthesis protein